jgi:ABC-type microcin C transport system duplicated ATPase subunit YejF
MIAIALACDPEFSLRRAHHGFGRTIQAQILKLMKDIRKQRNMSVILIRTILASYRLLRQGGGHVIREKSWRRPVKQLFRDRITVYGRSHQALPA